MTSRYVMRRNIPGLTRVMYSVSGYIGLHVPQETKLTRKCVKLHGVYTETNMAGGIVELVMDTHIVSVKSILSMETPRELPNGQLGIISKLPESVRKGLIEVIKDGDFRRHFREQTTAMSIKTGVMSDSIYPRDWSEQVRQLYYFAVISP